MPSKFKRINLTVPPEVYHALCLYQKAYGLDNDAGTALSLMISALSCEREHISEALGPYRGYWPHRRFHKDYLR